MTTPDSSQAIIFLGDRRIASGPLADAARQAFAQLGPDSVGGVLVFDAASSKPIDIDWRGTPAEIAARLQASDAVADTPPARGRPRLGVVAREVTLLPRHWEWLSEQTGGASVTLRKLIDQARQAEGGAGLRRRAQESAYRFMTAMAGNAPGFEEALRALYAGERSAFERHTDAWPADVRDHSRHLAQPVFAAGE
ncbi:hypothetical protein DFR29_12538 [Tahibacter aquaticus]|uniref:DUF2239 family protein n=1 Tax=Tahibacter aquaticus TaxID=520092 RepID=A0A4R6YKA4_9GAMM|nr:DUF2239 family protein [Tahibacter aquaticus]TDR37376.1 hypothetical protein DFR29_12538 [Tahibacter aquaticus]